MAARLDDWQKKKILADYVELDGNYSTTARANNCSPNTVKKIVKENAEVAKLCEQKKRENMVDVLAYMDSKKDRVCEFISKALDVLNDPDKLDAASLPQITTALGTLIDKWTPISGGPADDRAEDALSKSLRELGEKMDGEQDTDAQR